MTTTLNPEAYELLSVSDKAKYERVAYQENTLYYQIKTYDANQVEAIIKKVLDRAGDNAKSMGFTDANYECHHEVDKQSILTTPYEDLI